MARRLVFR